MPAPAIPSTDTSLIEVFSSLQGEGLLKVLPHRGAYVLSLTTDYVRDIYELRGIIAGLLARQSISRLTPERLAELDDIQNRFRKTVERYLQIA